MTTGQKIIKYLALGLAFFIISLIITGIYQGLRIASDAIGEKKLSNEPLKTTMLEGNITELKIDLGASDFKIMHGEGFKIESNSPYLKIEENNNVLYMTEDNYKIFGKYRYTVILYIPENSYFENVDIHCGVGKIEIEQLLGDNISLEIGAAKTLINEIQSKKKTQINAGTGELIIKSGSLTNANIELGVGSTDMNISMNGDNKIELGIGNLDLKLDSFENYTFNVSKGLGSVTINGEIISDDSIIGNGENYVSINGGIGNINIK